jgi:osmotically-inducible protein OsmY
MGRQQWVATTPIAFSVVMSVITPSVSAQNATSPNHGTAQQNRVVTVRPDELIGNALRSNPVTAPYPIGVRWNKGAVELSGVVGTKQIHDVAVRTAIAYGFPFRDNLVIDTAMTAQVAAAASGMAPRNGSPPPASVTASSYYVYPPPLMGKLDDPFFGFLPPLVSFPPWWKREGGTEQVAGGPSVAMANRAPGDNATNGPMAAPQAGWRALEMAPAQGEVEVTVDASGQVFLRGVVASEAVRREVEAMARSVPGVTRVISQFQIQPRGVPEGAPSGLSTDGAVPPPPPQPAAPPPAAAPRQPAMVKPRPVPPSQPTPKPGTPKASAPAGISSDNQELSRRVREVMERSDVLVNQSIKIKSDRDVVMLSGKVNTAFEAMLAFRAAQQAPGVREVIDILEFTVPDENHRNPLPQKGRPEDLEPYLSAQIRKNVGDLARIDQLRVNGDILTIQGTVTNDADLDRVLAIIRSIPILHGFRLEATLTSN